MKTQMIRITVGIALAGSVAFASGSELMKIVSLTGEVTEKALTLEPWMTVSIIPESAFYPCFISGPICYL